VWRPLSLSRTAILRLFRLPPALVEQKKAAGRLLPHNGCRLKGCGIRRRPGCLAAHRSGAVPPGGLPMTGLPGELLAASS
jgi:hypothetical protein